MALPVRLAGRAGPAVMMASTHIVVQLLLIAVPSTAAAVREQARMTMMAAGCAQPIIEMRTLSSEALEVLGHCRSLPAREASFSDHLRDNEP